MGDGDEMIHLPDLWEQPFTEPGLATSIAELDAGNETATGYGAGDHRRLALTTVPKGLPARELDAGQRHRRTGRRTTADRAEPARGPHGSAVPASREPRMDADVGVRRVPVASPREPTGSSGS